MAVASYGMHGVAEFIRTAGLAPRSIHEGERIVSFDTRTVAENVTVLDLDGELDRHVGLKKLSVAVGKIKPSAQIRLVLNFKGVTYICSEAVGMVCALAEEIRKAGGRAACCALTGLPHDVFEILGVSKILPLHATEEEAAKSLR